MFTAKNLASGTISRLKGEINGLGVDTKRFGAVMKAGFGIAAAGVIPLAAGAAGLATALNLADTAGQFELGIQKVANLSGATAEELAQLRDAAIEAGLKTQFSPTEATEGLANLAAAGFTASESMKLLNSSLNLAAGGQISIEEATVAASSAIRVFSLSADEGAVAVDKMLQISNLTNLSAKELSLALGTVSRGAGSTKQSLDEMLISMGLVRNTGTEASVAASSVSSALTHIASVAPKFNKIGVSVTNADGSFRNFLDIVADTDKALAGVTNQAEKGATVQELFGRFGLTAFTGISTQLRAMVGKEAGINNINDAIAKLRGQMANAEGTAQQFADRMLDTFEGQKTVLSGAIKTLTILLGEPFAAAFKPIVKVVATVVQAIARVLNNLPKSLKVAAAGFFLFASAITVAIGAMTVLIGLGIAAAPFFFAFIKLVLIASAVVLPLTLALIALGGAFAAMAIMIRNNMFGLGDFFARQWERIKLVVEAIKQLFTQGGFSGAVRDEMDKAENGGIRRFVINVFRIGSRILEFFSGVREGFMSVFSSISPVIDRMVEGFRMIGVALGLVSAETQGLADTPMDEFARQGARVGQILGDAFTFIVEGITTATEFVAEFIKGIKDGLGIFGGSFSALGESLSALATEISALFAEWNGSMNQGSTAAASFGASAGSTFGNLIALGVEFVRGFVDGIMFVIRIFRMFKAAIEGVVAFFVQMGIVIGTTFDNVVDHIKNALDFLIAKVGQTVAKIPTQFRPEFLDNLVIAGHEAEVRMAGRNAAISERTVQAGASIRAVTEQQSVEARTAGSRLLAGDEQNAAIVGEMARQREADRAVLMAQAKRPIVVEAKLDGQKVGEGVANADRREAARGFVPVPAIVE